MHQFFVDPSQINGTTIYILGSDVNHIRNVLRMKIGDEISVSNGQDGKDYRCGIETMEEGRIACRLWFVKVDGVELSSRVYLFQCLPKGDKMEWIIQKAVELGAYEIVPVSSKRCVVRLDPKRAETKRSRWQGVAEAAAKQSRRRIVPKVTKVMDFSEAAAYAASMDVKLIPYELWEGMEQTREIIGGLREGESIAVFIGPEGGFDEGEIRLAMEKGLSPITLGRRILRTETAGPMVLAWIIYRLEE
jgi:16S rRNA (uracil1498-N3)-methyltransferase